MLLRLPASAGPSSCHTLLPQGRCLPHLLLCLLCMPCCAGMPPHHACIAQPHLLTASLPPPFLDAACVCYLRAVGTLIYNFYMRQLPAAGGTTGEQQQPQQEQQEQQQEQQQQQQQQLAASGSGSAAGSGTPSSGCAADEAQGTWQLVYCESELLDMRVSSGLRISHAT